MKTFNVNEALKSGAYVCATTGHGKSDLAMKHAQQMMDAGHVVVIFDNSADWIRRSSVPRYVLVEQGVPFTVPIGESVIIDLSLLTPRKQFEVVDAVCKQIWNRQVKQTFKLGKPLKWFYLIFEEAQTYFPQGSFRAKKYDEMVRLFTGGRNFGIRVECVTQFSSMIDKNAMRYMRQRYFGFTDEPNDVEYVEEFLPNKWHGKLDKLQAGQFIYKFGSPRIIENPIFESTTKPKEIQKPIVEHQRKNKTSSNDMLINLQTIFQVVALLIFVATLLYALTL